MISNTINSSKTALQTEHTPPQQRVHLRKERFPLAASTPQYTNAQATMYGSDRIRSAHQLNVKCSASCTNATHVTLKQ